MTHDEIMAVRARIGWWTVPDWLIELAWQAFSHDVWAAGCIAPDADTISSFVTWATERER